MAKEKTEKVQVWSPPGRLSFPSILAPDVGREFSDGKYHTDLIITKADFKAKGAALQQAVLDVGKATFGTKFSLRGDFYVPFSDLDQDEKVGEQFKGCVKIRAKAKNKPNLIAPTLVNGKPVALSPDKAALIKGGDWALLYVNVFSWEKGGKGGVSLGLNGVQFWKAGEGFGQGTSMMMETAEELPVDELDEIETDEDSSGAEPDSFV